jgi:hypothetical protein
VFRKLFANKLGYLFKIIWFKYQGNRNITLSMDIYYVENNWLAITPNVNLISNIGFGGDGTHIVGESEFSKMKTYELKLTTHPKSVVQDKEADELLLKEFFYQSLF